MNSKTQSFASTEDNKSRSSKVNEGFFVKKKHAIILTVFVSFLFAGSILATYFGKPESVYHKYTHTAGMLYCYII